MTTPAKPAAKPAANANAPQLVSIHRRATTSATITSSAAEDAIQQKLVRRACKREGRDVAGRPAAAPRLVGGLPIGTWLVRGGAVAAVIALVVAVGSLAFRSGPPVPLHEFTANVVVGETVPVGARVVLHPRSRTLPGEVFPQGTVGQDGSVKFVTYPPVTGVPAGDYVATIQWFKVGPDGSVGGNVLPARYASPDKSPLVVTVVPKAAGNQRLQIAKR